MTFFGNVVKRVFSRESDRELIVKDFPLMKSANSIYKWHQITLSITENHLNYQESTYVQLGEENSVTRDPNINFFQCGSFTNKAKGFKVILLIGEVGAGKSTFANAFVNWLFGVKYSDKFRIQLISQGSSNEGANQTQYITAYTLFYQDDFRVPYHYILVDTPGIDVCEGCEKEVQLSKKLDEYFKLTPNLQLDQIDAILIVLKENCNRLTQGQKNIFNSIMAIFPKEIVEHIFLVITHDKQECPEPSCMAAVRKADVRYKTYFRFEDRQFSWRNANIIYEKEEIKDK